MQESRIYRKYLQEDGSYLYKDYRIWYEEETDEFMIMNLLFNCIEYYTNSLTSAFNYVDEQGSSYNDLED